jgi:hypothetical protein
VPLLAPTDEDVEAICAEVASRVLRMVERHREDAGDDDLGDEDGLSPTLPLAFAPGPSTPPAPRWEHPAQQRVHQGRRCAAVEGFSLHAGTTAGALDRRGPERLCRYGLRSSFALSRLSVKDDGTLRYRLKRSWLDGRIEPLELIPPPARPPQMRVSVQHRLEHGHDPAELVVTRFGEQLPGTRS